MKLLVFLKIFSGLNFWQS